jgi:hypothetical protein
MAQTRIGTPEPRRLDASQGGHHLKRQDDLVEPGEASVHLVGVMAYAAQVASSFLDAPFHLDRAREKGQ